MRSPTPPTTAVDLYNYCHCAHRVYLDANGDPALKSEVSPFVQLLWEKGLQTEREYIARLGIDDFVDLQGLSPEVAWAETQRLMQEGAQLIYQGCLIHEGRIGRPDLLLRHDDALQAWKRVLVIDPQNRGAVRRIAILRRKQPRP